MRKTIITIISSATVAVGSLGALVLAPAAPAHALTAPTNVANVCKALPEAKTALATEIDGLTKGLATNTATLATRRATMTSTISVFAGSIVNYLKALDANGNTTAAGDVLRGHQANFVDSVVDWSKVRTIVADNERSLTVAQLRSSFLQSAETAGCPAAI